MMYLRFFCSVGAQHRDKAGCRANMLHVMEHHTSVKRAADAERAIQGQRHMEIDFDAGESPLQVRLGLALVPVEDVERLHMPPPFTGLHALPNRTHREKLHVALCLI